MEEQIPTWLEAMRAFSWPQMLQVLVAALLGGFIGLEREWRGHEAGFRTNMLIAMGACLFTIISIGGFPLLGSTARDTSRVAAGIVTGIGFLGGGAILQSRKSVKGMTTAATVWLVAAIGMTVGVEAYALAVFSSIITFVILRFLQPVSRTVSHLGDD